MLRDALKDKVTFIVYDQAENAGSFGEKYVLTTEPANCSALHRSVPKKALRC